MESQVRQKSKDISFFGRIRWTRPVLSKQVVLYGKHYLGKKACWMDGGLGKVQYDQTWKRGKFSEMKEKKKGTNSYFFSLFVSTVTFRKLFQGVKHFTNSQSNRACLGTMFPAFPPFHS
jgi:hypothetical protein